MKMGANGLPFEILLGSIQQANLGDVCVQIRDTAGSDVVGRCPIC